MAALIPARAGSKRIPGKNTKLLGGIPLIAWTIAAAKDSGVFSDILVCSDDDRVFDCALRMDVSYRNRSQVPDTQPDIEWVRDAIETVTCARLDRPSTFAILRPTSPFRTAETIQRAYAQFCGTPDVHSFRAVELAKQHPNKMWRWRGPGYPIEPLLAATPLTDDTDHVTPYHSRPTQSLPKVYIQNSSLEMAWTYVVTSFGTISGTKIAPFFTRDYEGFSLDYPEDWDRAEALVAAGAVRVPSVDLARIQSPSPPQ